MPQPPPLSRDAEPEDRGFLDLPDFGRVFSSAGAWCRQNPLGAVLFAAAMAVIGYFYFGYKAFLTLTQTAAEWIAASWNPENDQEHCVAILPIAILLVALRWRDLQAAPKRPANSGLWFIAAGLFAFILGVRCVQGRFTICALPLLAYGTVRYLWGPAVSRIVVFPCVFLLFMIPFGQVVQSTANLQPKTAAAIASLSKVIGVPVHAEGNKIISLDGSFEDLEVAGGCSGIRSLMAMLMLAALYAYFTSRTMLRGLVLFGMAIGFAVVGNFARVFSVVLLAKFWDPQKATGWYHDSSGFVFFPVAVLAMVGVGNVLNRDWKVLLRKWGLTGKRPVLEAPAVPSGSVPSSADSTATTANADRKGTYDY